MNLFEIPETIKIIIDYSDIVSDLKSLMAINKFTYEVLVSSKIIRSAKKLYHIFDQWTLFRSYNKYTRFFLTACYSGNPLYLNVYAHHSADIDICSTDSFAFIHAARNGHIVIVKWLLTLMEKIESEGKNRINISNLCDQAFRLCCVSRTQNRLELAKWLIQYCMGSNRIPIDINAQGNFLFKNVCANGNLELAQWLVEISHQTPYTPIDIKACGHTAFEWSWANNHIHVAEWLALHFVD